MPEPPHRTDGELLSAVVAGDGPSFAVFYRRHLSAVVAFLLRETGNREATGVAPGVQARVHGLPDQPTGD